jgi:hypothetical protein
MKRDRLMMGGLTGGVVLDDNGGVSGYQNEIFKQEIMVDFYFAKLVGRFKLCQD